MSILSSAACGLLVFAALRVLRLLYERLARGPRLPYPPGPPGLPILGHLGFPPNPAWVKFRDWSEEYGTPSIVFGMARMAERVVGRFGYHSP